MKYKLLVTDIDGTLTANDGIINEKTAHTIKKAVEHGMYVVLASGRAFAATKVLREYLGLVNMPTICQNGAVVVDADGVVVEKYTLGSYLEPCKRGKEYGCGVVAWCGDELYCESYDERVAEYERILGVSASVRPFDELKDVTKVLWITTDEKAERLEAEMQSDKYVCHRSRKNFLEFVSNDATKGNALESIARMLGVSVSETVALGDGMNDISMLRSAGLGAAVKNAAKEAKENADTVIDTDVCDFILGLIDA